MKSCWQPRVTLYTVLDFKAVLLINIPKNPASYTVVYS